MLKAVISLSLVAFVLADGLSVAIGAAPQGKFQNISIGELSATVTKQLGKPTLYSRNEIAHYWTYPTDRNNAWLSVVIQDGYVVAIYIRSHPGRRSELHNALGIKLGDPVGFVDHVHGLKRQPLSFSTFAYPIKNGFFWIYEEHAGQITGIALTRTYLLAIPSQMTNDERDGASLDQAIVLKAQDAGRQMAESRYLQAQACAPGDSWRVISRKRLVLDKKSYDKLLVLCPSSKFRHFFYFESENIQRSPTASTNSDA